MSPADLISAVKLTQAEHEQLNQLMAGLIVEPALTNFVLNQQLTNATWGMQTQPPVGNSMANSQHVTWGNGTFTPDRHQMSDDEQRLWDAFAQGWDEQLINGAGYEKFKVLVATRRLAGDLTQADARSYIAAGLKTLRYIQKRRYERVIAARDRYNPRGTEDWAPLNKNQKLKRK